MNLAIFVWTFRGVIEAIAVGFVLLCFAMIGIGVGAAKLGDWWCKRKKKNDDN